MSVKQGLTGRVSLEEMLEEEKKTQWREEERARAAWEVMDEEAVWAAATLNSTAAAAAGPRVQLSLVLLITITGPNRSQLTHL